MAACEPVPQTLTLTGGQTGVDTVSRFLPAEGSLSLSNALDGQLTNAAYTGDLEKRVYLLSAPLWPGGVSGATRDVRTLELPLPTEAFATSSTVIAPDTAKWPCVRAYDIGLCSQQVPWNEFAQQLAEGVLAELKKRPDRVRSPSLTGVAEAFPILRGREGSEFDRVGFKMRFAASTIAGSEWTIFGRITGGCRSPVVEVSFDMSLGTKPGAYVEPTHDLDALAEALARIGAATTSGERGTLLADPAIRILTGLERLALAAFLPELRLLPNPGGGASLVYQAPRSPAPSADELDALLGRSWCRSIALDGPVPNAFDPTASVANLTVAIVSAGDCFGGGDRDKVVSGLLSAFTAALIVQDGVGVAIRDSLLQSPVAFGRPGLPLRRCSCDVECVDGASELPNPFGEGSGARHRCLGGTCGFQLEADRIEVRPEGLEFVLAEDDSDGQAAVFTDTDPLRLVSIAGLCEPSRGRTTLNRGRTIARDLVPGTFP